MNFRTVCLLALALVASACAPTRPDLGRLYENLSDDPAQPPIIVIHGLAGSTLVDAKTGKQFWPGSLSTLAFSNFRDLAQMSTEDREGEGLVPGDLVNEVARVDFYGELLQTLENVGRFHRGTPGEAAGGARRHYYVLLYDWRKDNLIAVRKLHALIEQIRRDYNDPNLRVDIVAHSNGGIITNYYLRYGPNDIPADGPLVPWDEGAKRIRRVAMMGTPTLGAVSSLERLIYGLPLALRTVPVEVMATFVTPFEALPHPKTSPILDPAGKPVPIDIYDVKQWRQRKWGVYSPEVETRVRESMASPVSGELAVTQLQATFEHNLERARRMQLALSAPFEAGGVEVAVFGGDCEPTPGHAIFLDDGNGGRLVFRPGQVERPGAKKTKADKTLYDRLLFEPGDGLVTRSSQTARRPVGVAPGDDGFHMLPIQQSFFLCESHGRLTHNLFFQDNLLYFLLSR